MEPMTQILINAHLWTAYGFGLEKWSHDLNPERPVICLGSD